MNPGALKAFKEQYSATYSEGRDLSLQEALELLQGDDERGREAVQIAFKSLGKCDAETVGFDVLCERLDLLERPPSTRPPSSAASEAGVGKVRSNRSNKGSVTQMSVTSHSLAGRSAMLTRSMEEFFESKHSRFPVATIGRGPGHTALSAPTSSPGPQAYRVNESHDSHNKCQPRATIGNAPGHGGAPPSWTTPGPAAYYCNDKALAHHTKMPSATINRGAGHQGMFRPSDVPGPGAYGGSTSQSSFFSVPKFSVPKFNFRRTGSLPQIGGAPSQTSVEVISRPKTSAGDGPTLLRRSRHGSDGTKLHMMTGPGPLDYKTQTTEKIPGGSWGRAHR